MNHVLANILRGPRITHGHSPMLFTRRGEIVIWKYKGIESCEARYFRKLNRKIIPAMPCQTVTETSTETPLTTHRPRSEHHPVYNAMVARLLTSKEVQSNPEALQAILEEGEKLLKQGVWDITSVRERRDVIQEATRLNKKVHFARIFPICSEKGSELPEGDPDRNIRDDV